MGRIDHLRRLQDFAQCTHLTLDEQLGYGMHGIIFAAKTQTDGQRLAGRAATFRPGNISFGD